MIDPKRICFFIPAGLRKFKMRLFERIAAKIESAGGRVVRYNPRPLATLPNEIIPVVGCMAECTPLIAIWRANGRKWCYWDRGYL